MTQVKGSALITFDYELFLGTQSGTVEACMLKPTNAIAKVLSKHNAKAIFFIDSYYLHVLKQQAAIHSEAQQDYLAIKQQLTQLYNAGHYIYYHLHPHWIDAIYNTDSNTWTLPHQKNYCFSDLSTDKQAEVFDASVYALNEILQGVNSYKQPDGFRAGGLYIQPFEIFKPHFERHGIKYEFSVLPGATGKGINAAQVFDFTKVQKLLYRFANDVTKEEKGGRFTQYGLEVCAINGVDKLLNRVYASIAARIADTRIYGKGLPTKNKISFDANKYPLGKWNSYEIYSAENLNSYKVGMYVNHLRKTGYLHLLSHPKLMSPHSVAQLDKLLGKISTLGSISYDFKDIAIA